MLSREEMLQEEPGLNAEGLLGGAQYYDAQVSFAERLVLGNIIGAKEAGADVRNYSPVIGINVRQGTVRGLQFIDGVSGTEVEVSAGLIINAAGPWVDRILATVNREMPRFMGGTKGSHIIVGRFEGSPRSAFYVEARADGRPFFIIPWNDQYLIGTTDIRYEGDPGDVAPSDAEVQYLLTETNRVFPAANLVPGDIHYAYAGVRPLPRRDKGPESAITRKHIIRNHKKQARGLVSVIGGKLTTYRNLSEQVVDMVVRQLRVKVSDCQTRSLPLPGATALAAAEAQLSEPGDLSPGCIKRLLGIYGSRAVHIMTLAQSDSVLAKTIDNAETVITAEVVYALRHEMAVSLIDIVHRRMMTGLLPDQGASMNDTIATIAATEIAWDKSEKEQQLTALREYNERLRPSSN